ncbi:GNAT family N-acetyltransferase [Weissella minor]|nr:GNAT family protein [Weissella minor]
MMALGERIGMKLEGQIRAVRYWQGEFYDSVKYGILRSEMEQM